MTLAAPQRLPYPGLRAFRRDESDLFFGREDCINAMVDRLAATRLLAVLGSSGTGKSSVAKTGLLDALDLGLMAPAGSCWRVVELRPGGAPLKNLALALLQTRTNTPEAAAGVSDADAALFRAFLLRGPLSVAEWCADGHLPKDTNLLLLVDQFEELFRYQDYAGREEAEAFVALLLESARQSKVPIYVALTMRSEYLGACALIDGLAEAISAGLVLIPRMTREQCRSAILGPAAVCGFKIEEALVNRLLNDLAAFAPWDDRGSRDQLDRLARRADQLPLLQYCLNRMWIRARAGADRAPVVLTIADYEQIGGLQGALDESAIGVLQRLGDDSRAVVETVFRALTDGSTATDAVRRPTRYAELVEICNGDEAAVRKVVNAFRETGRNFLAPELVRVPDLVQPVLEPPITSDTIIDISHESLIRQWRQLSQWVEAEERARRQWRRLLDRFEDRQPLFGRELANAREWRDTQRPTAAWARRYGGDFNAVMKFLDESEQKRKRFAPLIMPLFSFAAFGSSAVFGAGFLGLVMHQSTVPSYATTVILAVSVALTGAFGLWRYAGTPLVRSVLAGAAIAAVLYVVGTAFVDALMRQHLSQAAATFWFNVSFAAPCVVTVLALFEPTFRRPSVWFLLVATYAVPPMALFSYSGNVVPANDFVMVAGWWIWCAVFGYQLLWSRKAVEPGERNEVLAACKLGLFGYALYYVNAVWIIIVLDAVYGATQPAWTWIINVAAYSEVLAIAIAVGLWRDRGLTIKSSALAGLTIFALEFVCGTGVIAILTAYKVAPIAAFHWVGATLVAPLLLVGMMIFDRTFRRIPVWLLSAALFAVPYAGLVLLFDDALISLNLFNGLVAVLALLWIAAIAYWLQRAPHDTPSRSSGAPMSAASSAPAAASPAVSQIQA